jgi:hypothetical protein
MFETGEDVSWWFLLPDHAFFLFFDVLFLYLRRGSENFVCSAKFGAKNTVNYELMIFGGSYVLQNFRCLLIQVSFIV